MADLAYMELNQMQLFDVLRAASVIRLAVCEDGQPYLIPMAFQLEVRGSRAVIHLAAPASGRKIDALRGNGRVCLEAELPGCAWVDVVLVEGTARIGAAEGGGVHIRVPADSMTGRRFFLPQV